MADNEPYNPIDVIIQTDGAMLRVILTGLTIAAETYERDAALAETVEARALGLARAGNMRAAEAELRCRPLAGSWLKEIAEGASGWVTVRAWHEPKPEPSDEASEVERIQRRTAMGDRRLFGVDVSLDDIEGACARLRLLVRYPDLSPFSEPVIPPNECAFGRAVAMLWRLKVAGVGVRRVELTAIGGLALWVRRGRHFAVVECANDGDRTLAWNHPELGPDGWIIDDPNGIPMAETLSRLRQFMQRQEADGDA